MNLVPISAEASDVYGEIRKATAFEDGAFGGAILGAAARGKQRVVFEPKKFAKTPVNIPTMNMNTRHAMLIAQAALC